MLTIGNPVSVNVIDLFGHTLSHNLHLIHFDVSTVILFRKLSKRLISFRDFVTGFRKQLFTPTIRASKISFNNMASKNFFIILLKNARRIDIPRTLYKTYFMKEATSSAKFVSAFSMPSPKMNLTNSKILIFVPFSLLNASITSRTLDLPSITKT